MIKSHYILKLANTMHYSHTVYALGMYGHGLHFTAFTMFNLYIFLVTYGSLKAEIILSKLCTYTVL